MGLCSEQPVLRGLILISSIFLLGLGIVMTTVGVGGAAGLLHPELERVAALLKVSVTLTKSNLLRLFWTVALTGYGTINVGTVAVCAASGGRRVHSAAAAVCAGAAAVVYLTLLVAVIKPQIQVISNGLDKALDRYFQAFKQTGDEKFLSQIHLQNGCCGLDSGPADFSTWQKPLPSSCCGLFTGNCSHTKSRSLPCRQKIKRLSGDDGLFDLGYFVWILGGNCIGLCCLLLLLLLTTSGDTIGLLVRIRQQTEEMLLRHTAGGGKVGDKPAADRVQRENLERDARTLLDDSKLNQRDKQLLRVLGGSGGEASRQKRLQIQRLLDEEIRLRTGGSKRPVAKPRGGGPERELELKMMREIETDRLRLMDRMLSSARSPPPPPPLLTPSNRGGGAPQGTEPSNKLLSEKLRQEAEAENRRVKEIQLAEEIDRQRREAANL